VKKVFQTIALVLGGLIIISLGIPKLAGRATTGPGPSKSELATIKSLLDSFNLNCGRYPTTEEGLSALESPPADLAKKWRGPYGSHPFVDDYWGHPYEYTSVKPDRFNLISFGADGKTGGEGDNVDLVVNE